MSAAHAISVQRIEADEALGTAGPEAVQITGRIRFRQPCFLDITYTRRYLWWFLPGTFVCIGRFVLSISSVLLGRPGGVAQLGERLNGIQEVRGSIPLTSTGPEVRGCMCGNSSVGRAQPCQGWGRGFESRFPLWWIRDHEGHGIGTRGDVVPVGAELGG